MVREALSGCAKIVAIAAALAFPPGALAAPVLACAAPIVTQGSSPAGGAAIAEALVLAQPMPAPDASLPADVQKRQAEYRERERSFKSGLAPPRGGSAEELALYRKRLDIERVIFSLFPRKDSARVAAGYALDVDLDREAPFIDELLGNLPVPWLAPYLNLVAGHRKLCDGRNDDARRQLVRARDGGHPLIRVAAEYLIAAAACAQQ